MSAPPRRDARRGMTIVECLIAILVLLMGFLAVASCYPMSYREATFDKNRVMALSLAHDLLNQARTVPWGQPLPGQMTTPISYTDTVEGRTVKVVFFPSVAFLRGQNHFITDASHSSDICVVTVQWHEQGTGEVNASGPSMPMGFGAGAPPRQIQVSGGVSREY